MSHTLPVVTDTDRHVTVGLSLLEAESHAIVVCTRLFLIGSVIFQDDVG